MATESSEVAVVPPGLVSWKPTPIDIPHQSRWLFVTQALCNEIDASPWPCSGTESPARADRRRRDTVAFLSAFLLGDELTVGIGDDHCDVKCLYPPPYQEWTAWELRITVKAPHTRIFGVFLSPLVFVGMSMVAKHRMNREEQTNEARTAVAKFQSICRGRRPLSFRASPTAMSLGGTANGYRAHDF